MEKIFWEDSFHTLGQAIIKLHNVIESSKVDKNDYVLDCFCKKI